MNKKVVVAAMLAAFTALSLTACGGEATPTTSTQSSGSATGAAGTPQVKIVAKDNVFEPLTYTVQAGTFQIWAVNEGKEIHDVEVKDLFPETKLAAGQSKAVDVKDVKPGTYKIYCEIHEDQGMVGTLEVK